MRLLFAGTPEVAVPSLEALINSSHEVVAVLTRPPAPAGRGRAAHESPVAQRAREHSIPILSPASARDPEFAVQLSELRVDCAPIVAFGGLIPADLLAVPTHGWVNLHFSLLPAWRGAAPVQHAVWNGDAVTGACTFILEQGLDTGPVYGCIEEPIGPTDTAGHLLARLSERGATLLVDTMDAIAEGTAHAQPQSESGVSLAPKITVEDARIHWDRSAQEIDRQIRACSPHPGAWTVWGEQRIKIGSLEVEGRDAPVLAPGEVRISRAGVWVGTGSQSVQLGSVQAPGKKMMPASDWARGLRSEGFLFD